MCGASVLDSFFLSFFLPSSYFNFYLASFLYFSISLAFFLYCALQKHFESTNQSTKVFFVFKRIFNSKKGGLRNNLKVRVKWSKSKMPKMFLMFIQNWFIYILFVDISAGRFESTKMFIKTFGVWHLVKIDFWHFVFDISFFNLSSRLLSKYKILNKGLFPALPYFQLE